jgi:hypothetical protein
MNESSGRRIEGPSVGTKEVQDAFNAWCEILTAHSLQASYAIIAANWARRERSEKCDCFC